MQTTFTCLLCGAKFYDECSVRLHAQEHQELDKCLHAAQFMDAMPLCKGFYLDEREFTADFLKSETGNTTFTTAIEHIVGTKGTKTYWNLVVLQKNIHDGEITTYVHTRSGFGEIRAYARLWNRLLGCKTTLHTGHVQDYNAAAEKQTWGYVYVEK